MMEMIFFGGLVAGFLIGWIGMAILTMSSLHNRQKILMEQVSASHEDGRN